MPVVKTAVQQQWNQVVSIEPPFKVLSTADVDGVPWYTILPQRSFYMDSRKRRRR